MSINNRGKSRFSPEYALLGFLYQAPSYGYELHQRLQELFGDIWHASQSQTYNILKRLELQEYINSSLIEQDKHPPRQQLHITPVGRKRFEAWLSKPTSPSVHAIRVEFITRVYFLNLFYPDRIPAMVKVQIDSLELALKSLKQRIVETPADRQFNRLALELRVELLNSVIRWLVHNTESIGEGVQDAGS